jgi:hypothetical protein
MVWHAATAPDLGKAQFASSEVLPIEPHADLAGLKVQETERASQAGSRRDVLAAISAFEATTWSLVRFTLYRDAPLISGDGEIYRVGHMSLPA